MIVGFTIERENFTLKNLIITVFGFGCRIETQSEREEFQKFFNLYHCDDEAHHDNLRLERSDYKKFN